MAFTWIRATWTSTDFNLGNTRFYQALPGQTLVRAHLRWGAYGDTSTAVDMSQIPTNIVTLGIVTTVGTGSETPPNARSASGDADPPTQRWTYWETRSFKPTAISADLGVITWTDTGATEPTDTRGQVLAQDIPDGQYLNIWASWASAYAWDPSGSAVLWGAASILIDVH